VDGSDAAVDRAKKLMPGINQFLRQQITEKKDFKASVAGLRAAMGLKKGGKS
jgi:flagellum-specific ATP synthase